MRKLTAVVKGRVAKLTEALSGMLSATPIPDVVPLVCEFYQYITDWMIFSGVTVENAEAKKKSQKVWYGVVDGFRFYCSVMWLSEKSNGWNLD